MVGNKEQSRALIDVNLIHSLLQLRHFIMVDQPHAHSWRPKASEVRSYRGVTKNCRARGPGRLAQLLHELRAISFEAST